MNDDASCNYFLWDSKTHERKEFSSLAAAQVELKAWIDRQRHAGEPVMEQPGGQWSDSRVSVWIADSSGRIIRLDVEADV